MKRTSWMALGSALALLGCSGTSECPAIDDYQPASARLTLTDIMTGEPICEGNVTTSRHTSGYMLIAHVEDCWFEWTAWHLEEGDGGSNVIEVNVFADGVQYLPAEVTIEPARDDCGRLIPPDFDLQLEPNPDVDD